MPNGVVKWFNPTKRFGFIERNGNGDEKDIFVHITAVEEAGLGTLVEGQHLEFDISTDAQGKMSAINLKSSDG